VTAYRPGVGIFSVELVENMCAVVEWPVIGPAVGAAYLYNLAWCFPRQCIYMLVDAKNILRLFYQTETVMVMHFVCATR
jgi:hypothetical protein